MKLEQEKKNQDIPQYIPVETNQKENTIKEKFNEYGFKKLLNSALINIKAQEYDYSIKELEKAMNMNYLPNDFKKQILETKSFIKAREDADAIKILNQIIAHK